MSFYLYNVQIHEKSSAKKLFLNFELLSFFPCSIFTLPTPFPRSNSYYSLIILRLLFDCCPINKRTTIGHQSDINRTSIGQQTNELPC